MIPVAAPLVPAMWPHALPLLAPTIAMGGENTPAAIYAALLEGRMVLWRNDWAYAVTRWEDWPLGRTAYVIVGGREPKAWIRDAVAVWKQWARDLGCTQIRMTGRPGWQRLVPEAEPAVGLRILL